MHWQRLYRVLWLEIHKFLPDSDMHNLRQCCRSLCTDLDTIKQGVFVPEEKQCSQHEWYQSHGIHLNYIVSYQPLKWINYYFPQITRLDWNYQDCLWSFGHNLPWPKHLTHLTLGHKVKVPISKLPTTLKHLTLDQHWSGNQTSLLHLSHLKVLNLGHQFNEALPALCSTLHTLELGNKYNQSLLHLPLNLKVLRLGDDFQQMLPNLPSQLQSLTIGREFNQSSTQFPTSLTYLNLGRNFNYPLATNLLPNLHTLKLDLHFSHPLDHLPSSLKILHVHSMYSRLISRLPSNLEELSLGLFHTIAIEALSLSRIKKLNLVCPAIDETLRILLPRLPHTLTHLTLIFLSLATTRLTLSWPSHIEHLDFKQIGYQEIEHHWPVHIKSLKLKGAIHTSTDPFPQELEELHLTCPKFCDDSARNFLAALPQSLKILTIKSGNFNQPLTHLPPGLKHLTLEGSFFNQSLDHLPRSLQTLKIDCARFDQGWTQLPESLQELIIKSEEFTQGITLLPPSLHVFIFQCPKYRQILLPTWWQHCYMVAIRTQNVVERYGIFMRHRVHSDHDYN
jgi:hypothetical protein